VFCFCKGTIALFALTDNTPSYIKKLIYFYCHLSHFCTRSLNNYRAAVHVPRVLFLANSDMSIARDLHRSSLYRPQKLLFALFEKVV